MAVVRYIVSMDVVRYICIQCLICHSINTNMYVLINVYIFTYRSISDKNTCIITKNNHYFRIRRKTRYVLQGHLIFCFSKISCFAPVLSLKLYLMYTMYNARKHILDIDLNSATIYNTPTVQQEQCNDEYIGQITYAKKNRNVYPG